MTVVAILRGPSARHESLSGTERWSLPSILTVLSSSWWRYSRRSKSGLQDGASADSVVTCRAGPRFTSCVPSGFTGSTYRTASMRAE
jgi:hypothetical protein